MGKIYKIQLISLLSFIFLASQTSGLLVLNPGTWFNIGSYSPHVHISDLFSRESSFYFGYLDNNRTLHDLNMEFYIRKVVHALTYGALAFLFIKSFNFKYFLLAPIFCFVVATLDEINQYLLIGRSGRLADIILDTSSSLLVTFVFFLFAVSPKKN